MDDAIIAVSQPEPFRLSVSTVSSVFLCGWWCAPNMMHGLLSVYQVSTGRLLWSGRIAGLASSLLLSADNSRLAAQSDSNTHVLDARTGREICRVKNSITSAFSPDSKLLATVVATGRRDPYVPQSGNIAVYDILTGLCLWKKSDEIYGVSIDWSSAGLVVCFYQNMGIMRQFALIGGRLQVYNADALCLRDEAWPHRTDEVVNASRDGRRLLLRKEMFTFVVYDMSTGKFAYFSRWSGPELDGGHVMRLTADGSTIVVVTHQAVYEINVDSQTIAQTRHMWGLRRFQMIDKKDRACLSMDGVMRDIYYPINPMLGPMLDVPCPENHTFVSSAVTSVHLCAWYRRLPEWRHVNLHVYQMPSGKLLWLETTTDFVINASFSDDSSRLAVQTIDNSRRPPGFQTIVYETQTGHKFWSCHLVSYRFRPVFSPDNRFLAAIVSSDSRLYGYEECHDPNPQSVAVFDVQTGSRVWVIFDWFYNVSLDWSSAGLVICHGQQGKGRVEMFDIRARQRIFTKCMMEHTLVHASRNGRRLVLKCHPRQTCSVFDVPTGKFVCHLSNFIDMCALAMRLSADGTVVVAVTGRAFYEIAVDAGTARKTVYQWDLPTLPRHLSSVMSSVMSWDGSLVCTQPTGTVGLRIYDTFCRDKLLLLHTRLPSHILQVVACS